jgi:hypothetical protein
MLQEIEDKPGHFFGIRQLVYRRYEISRMVTAGIV